MIWHLINITILLQANKMTLKAIQSLSLQSMVSKRNKYFKLMDRIIQFLVKVGFISKKEGDNNKCFNK